MSFVSSFSYKRVKKNDKLLIRTRGKVPPTQTLIDFQLYYLHDKIEIDVRIKSIECIQ